MENEKNNEEKVEIPLNENTNVIIDEEEDCRDPIDFLEEESSINLSLTLNSLYKDKDRLESLVCELRKEIQSNYFETTEEKTKLINENSKFKVLNEDLNKSLDSFENIQTQKNLETLISAVNAASNAYEKVPTEQVRGAAKGLALAAIGKLHMFIDKI